MELTLRPTMRGEDKKQSSMLMLMSPETRVPQTHPLRAIKKLADEGLRKLSPNAVHQSTTPFELGQRPWHRPAPVADRGDSRFEGASDLVPRSRLDGRLHRLHRVVDLSGDELSQRK